MRFFQTNSNPGRVEYKLKWPSRFVKQGVYENITFTASDGSGSEDSEIITITIIGVNPPSIPTGLKAVLDEAHINISWNGNPEPDLAGYKIYYDTTPFTGGNVIDIADPSATSFRLDIPGLSQVQAEFLSGKPVEDFSHSVGNKEEKVKYASDEIIIKFKPQAANLPAEDITTLSAADNALPLSIKTLNRKFGVRHLEKVFKHSPRKDRISLMSKTLNMPDLSYIYKVKLTPSQNIEEIVEKYTDDPNVEYAEPNYIFETFESALTKYYISIAAYNGSMKESQRSQEVSVPLAPNDLYFRTSGSWEQPYEDLWGLHKIETLEAWKDETGNPDVIIAVVDTGLDYGHEDIAQNMWTNIYEIPGNGIDDDANGFVDDVRGWDFAYDDNDPIDGDGHGTHVAGIAAAAGNNEVGVVGVAWGCKIMPVKGLNDYGNGYASDLAESLIYAADKGANVINNSWGSSSASLLLKDAIDYAHGSGCVVVAAAGNSHSIAEFYPAAYDNVISVGASNYLDNRASFSNFGGCVDVFAPGRDILSLRASGTYMGEPLNALYTLSDGTSMASPFVAGLSALLFSKNPDFNNEDIANIIKMSAYDIGTTGWDFETAYGRIDVFKACSIMSPPDLHASVTAPAYNSPLKEDLVSVQGLARGEDFSGYKLEYGRGTLPDEWVEISQGGVEVVDAELGLWNISNLSDGIFIIKLTVFGREAWAKKVFLRRVFIAKSEEEGWPVKIPGRITSSPSIADVDKDGKLDIAIGAIGEGYNEGLYYLLNSNGSIKEGWPVTTANWNDNSPLLADLDNDGYDEVVTLSFENPGVKTFAWDYLGNLRDGWPKDSRGSSAGLSFGFAFFRMNAPVIYDINGDGFLDIMSQDIGDSLYIYDKKGNQLDGWPAEVQLEGDAWLCGMTSVPVILPNEQSGECDIFIPLQINTYVTDNYEFSSKIFGFHNDGFQIEGWPVELPVDVISDTSSAACDVDNDGEKEIIFTIYGAKIIDNQYYYKLFIGVLNENGSFVEGWPKLIDYNNVHHPSLAVAKLDAGHLPKIIVTYDKSNSTIVNIYNLDGTFATGWPKEFPDTMYISYPTVGDIDGDGISEVLVCLADNQDTNGISYTQPVISTPGVGIGIITESKNERLNSLQSGNSSRSSENSPFYTGNLYALKGDGTVLEQWPIPTGFAISAPTLCDIDTDGKVEVILTDYNGWIHVWELGNYDSSTIEWPMYRHDSQHTGLYTGPID